jgi:hypothetical protein
MKIAMPMGGERRGGLPFSESLRSPRAGVVRKKLGLPLQSEKTDGERVYRAIEPQAA